MESCGSWAREGSCSLVLEQRCIAAACISASLLPRCSMSRKEALLTSAISDQPWLTGVCAAPYCIRITVAGIIAHPWFRTNLPRGVASINELLLQTPLETRVSYCHQSEAEIVGVVGAAHHKMDTSRYGTAAEEMAAIIQRAAQRQRASFERCGACYVRCSAGARLFGCWGCGLLGNPV